jgi:ornithine cyclodeaminase/alanine dehydrogenase-like protein (mu-crystallin family)
VWGWAECIVLDSSRALQESGDGQAARAAGTLDDNKVCELHEVVVGKAPGRRDLTQNTLYKSVGTGLQDLAVAYRAYLLASARGLGHHLADYQAVKHTALD